MTTAYFTVFYKTDPKHEFGEHVVAPTAEEAEAIVRARMPAGAELVGSVAVPARGEEPTELGDLAIPEFLQRRVTPESEAAVRRLNKQLSRRQLRRLPKSEQRRSSISAGPVLTDPVSIALKKEVETAARAKREERFARLRELKGDPMKPRKKAAPAKGKAPAKPKKKIDRLAELLDEPKAAPPAAPPAEGGPRAGSKLEAISVLLRRPEGCTTADVLKATGWPSVSMPAQAKALGVGLRKEKEGGAFRYFATV